MIIQGLERAADYRAHVLAELYGITVEQARALKLREQVEVDETTLNRGIFETDKKIATEVI